MRNVCWNKIHNLFLFFFLNIHGPWKYITYKFACDANRWNWKFNFSKNNSFFLRLSSLTLSNSFWLHSNSFSFDVSVVLKAIHSVSSYTFIINIYVWFNALCKIDYRPWTSWDVRRQSYSPFNMRKGKWRRKTKYASRELLIKYIPICTPAHGTLFSIQSSHLDDRYEITDHRSNTNTSANSSNGNALV